MEVVQEVEVTSKVLGQFFATRKDYSLAYSAYRRRNGLQSPNVPHYKRTRNEKRFGIAYPTFWLCDVCNLPICGQNIVLDHDHITNQFRGWLCHPCNRRLSFLESPWFEKGLRYLENLGKTFSQLVSVEVEPLDYSWRD